MSETLRLVNLGFYKPLTFRWGVIGKNSSFRKSPATAKGGSHCHRTCMQIGLSTLCDGRRPTSRAMALNRIPLWVRIPWWKNMKGSSFWSYSGQTGKTGIEPILMVLETTVLRLNYSPTWMNIYMYSILYNKQNSRLL